ncbi:MAG: dephospho-CoA kinase [Acidobacteriia bacterium]|nr:dephospho-CoA kinase [Terriglobia bacterium]
MLKVGLTGGVACGKSTVGEMLVARGARLIKADEIAHRLMRPGQPVYQEVVRHFGRGIVHEDGTIDRQKLAQAAFGGGRVEELNRLVHPAVIAHQERWMEEEAARHRNAVVIVEAALIVEAGVQKRFNKIIMVTCRPEQKAARFAERQGITVEVARQEVARRQAAQRSDEEKIRAADYVIDNSGSPAETERQVEQVFRELKQLAISL